MLPDLFARATLYMRASAVSKYMTQLYVYLYRQPRSELTGFGLLRGDLKKMKLVDISKSYKMTHDVKVYEQERQTRNNGSEVADLRICFRRQQSTISRHPVSGYSCGFPILHVCTV